MSNGAVAKSRAVAKPTALVRSRIRDTLLDREALQLAALRAYPELEVVGSAQEGREAYKAKRAPDFSRFPKRP